MLTGALMIKGVLAHGREVCSAMLEVVRVCVVYSVELGPMWAYIAGRWLLGYVGCVLTCRVSPAERCPLSVERLQFVSACVSLLLSTVRPFAELLCTLIPNQVLASWQLCQIHNGRVCLG